jgi:hypothetical protein
MIPDPELGAHSYGEGSMEEEALADLRGAPRAYFEAFRLDCAMARSSMKTGT